MQAPHLECSKVQVVNSVHGSAITTLNINLFALTERTESFPSELIKWPLIQLKILINFTSCSPSCRIIFGSSSIISLRIHAQFT